MTLAAEQGSKLLVRFDGPDEKEACQAMSELFESGFGEPM
jgi:phosphotransferase system HPr-like phosphotransfer protein